MEGSNCTIEQKGFQFLLKKSTLLNHLKTTMTAKILSLVVLLFAAAFMQSAFAQSPQASINQGNNGTLPNQIEDPIDWVNGNLNESQNHYLEGQSIPYRAVLDRFKVGCETKIRIAFDARRNSHMAIDYLTSNNWFGPHSAVYPGHPLEAVNPLLGLSGTFTAPSFATLPGPGTINSPVAGQGQASYNQVATAGLNKMAIYNGSISSIVWVTQPNFSESLASSEAVIEVTFTASALPVVLSWGGHIASRIDWGFSSPGEPRSAGGISGSPYHMRLLDWDVTGVNASSCSPSFTSIGSQDRSLQISAPPCETITATVTVNDANYNVNNTIGLNVVPSGGIAPYTYAWTSTPGSPLITFNNATIANPIATIGNTLTASFTVVVTDAIGCQTTITRTLEPGDLIRPCGIEGPSEVCPNTSSQFTFPFAGATSITWSVTGNGSINGPTTGSPVTVVSSNVCGGQYVVVVTAVFPNQTVTCSTTVTVLTPVQATFATAPGNVTVACGAIPPLVSLAYTNGTATGGCGINGSVMPVRSGSYTVCGGTLTDTWTFTDLCNRTITASRTITVNPAAAATFSNTPGNITLAACATALPTASTLNYSNGLTGDCLISGTSPLSTITLTSGQAPCQRVYTETWSATDICQRPITHSRTITVPAAAAAAFVNPPGNTTVPCSQAPSTNSSNPLSYSNGLAGICAISGTVNSVITGSHNSCGGSYVETWTFNDPCGRGSVVHSRTITVSAAPAPAFVNPPANIVGTCLTVVPPIGTLNYTNAGSGACLISGSVQGVRTSTYDGCSGVFTDTWTIPAPCPGGSPIVHVRTITIERDNVPPTFTSCPAGANLGCNPTSIPAAGVAVAIDACGTPTITSVLGPEVGTGCVRTRTRTYTATDACGNTSTCQQVFTYTVDVTPPTFTSCPAGADLGCNPTSIPAPGTPVATDACGAVTFTSSLGAEVGTGCVRTRTRTYTATDACGNTSTCQQVFTYTVDVTPPTITSCPAGSNLGCNPTSIPAPGTPTATDACGAVTFTSSLGAEVGTGCVRTRTRTYTATDACGNTSTCQQVFTYTVDVTPPTFTSCPAGSNLGCNPTSIPAPGTPTATDACGAVTFTSSLGAEVGTGCVRTRTRTYTATDACGNTSTCQQVFTYTVDVTPPTFTSCPAGSNLGCNPTSIPAAGTPTATDACGAVTFTSSLGAEVGTGCVRTRTRTYTATDACGNTSTCQQVFTYTVDVTPPTITSCPAGANLGCNPTSIPAAGTPVATDACGAVTFTSVLGAEVGTGCVRTRTRTYTATDACGNTATCTQVFTYTVDRTAPVLTNTPPATIEAPCGTTFAQLPWVAPTWTDACGAVTTVSVVTTPNQEVACPGVYSRTWTVSDACGNTASFTQTITVECCHGCTFTQGAYGSAGGNHCNGDGTSSNSLTQITNALTRTGGYTFGSVATNRYWRVEIADAAHVMNEMLPGGGNSQKFGQRVGGGTWAQSNTWSVAPLQQGGPNTGKIKNSLFAQTLTMYLNLHLTAASMNDLGNIVLSDTMITRAASTCGPDAVPVGAPDTFGLPHAVVVYLANPANGYANTIAGLFRLANDVLGGVNTAVDPGLVSDAVDVLNNAFDECRFLTGRVPYAGTGRMAEPVVEQQSISVTASPNPYNDRIVFTIKSNVSGKASFQLVGLLGEKVANLFEGVLEKGAVKTIIYNAPATNRKTMVYQLRVGDETVSGKVLYLN